MYLSVILPVYNEVKVIKDTLLNINGYLREKEWLSEIIIVNDGSSDNSVAEINKVKLDNLKLISFPFNQGKGAAVKAGMLAAQGKLMLFMDADNSTEIREIDKFIPYIESGLDIIIGSRALKQSKIVVPQPKIKVFLGKLGLILTALLGITEFKDTQCGFKLFTRKCRRLFEQQTIKRWGFDIELLYLARKSKLKVLELPVTWRDDPHSKVRLLDYPRTILDLIKIQLNNLKGTYDKS